MELEIPSSAPVLSYLGSGLRETDNRKIEVGVMGSLPIVIEIFSAPDLEFFLYPDPARGSFTFLNSFKIFEAHYTGQPFSMVTVVKDSISGTNAEACILWRIFDSAPGWLDIAPTCIIRNVLNGVGFYVENVSEPVVRVNGFLVFPFDDTFNASMWPESVPMIRTWFRFPSSGVMVNHPVSGVNALPANTALVGKLGNHYTITPQTGSLIKPEMNYAFKEIFNYREYWLGTNYWKSIPTGLPVFSTPPIPAIGIWLGKTAEQVMNKLEFPEPGPVDAGKYNLMIIRDLADLT